MKVFESLRSKLLAANLELPGEVPYSASLHESTDKVPRAGPSTAPSTTTIEIAPPDSEDEADQQETQERKESIKRK